MQGLEPPATGHEFRSQPVEQLGMSGLVAHDAEVVGRGDEPAAEVELPDPVGDDRATSGFSGRVSQCASQSLRPVERGVGPGLPG